MIAHVMICHAFKGERVWWADYGMHIVPELHQLTGQVHQVNTLSTAIRVSPVTHQAYFHNELLYDAITSLYTESVFSAATGHAKFSTARILPFLPSSFRNASSFSSVSIASFSAPGSSGGTSMPASPTTS